MMEKPSSPNNSQTVTGNENIQIAGSNNVVNRITNFFTGDTEQQRAQRNRRPMLELVKNTWIKGVLDKSLYNEVLIDLGMEDRPDAVDHPWDMQVQMPDRTKRFLSQGTSMKEVFSEMNRAILILGEPGSGKTTMLLELARALIATAEQDDTEPIPVIFNLSSWSSSTQAIDDWLIIELNNKYNVPKKLAQNWVLDDELQLLLDGLDEVKWEQREACVKAINDFRQRHGLAVPIAVCSRIADYESLEANLNLSGAVLLQPLTSEQIDEYMERIGPEISSVRRALQHDDVLQELVRQPLLLSIMILAYRGISIDEFESEYTRTIEARRKHLFDTYIQQMFKRAARTRNDLYNQLQTKRWLLWLAKLMLRQNQSVFHIELLQPRSLTTDFQRQIVAAGPAILGFLIIWCLCSVFFPSSEGLGIAWLIGWSVGVMFAAFLYSNDIKPVQGLSWSWARFVALIRNEFLTPLPRIISALRLPRGHRRLVVRIIISQTKLFRPVINFALYGGLLGVLLGAINGGWIGGLSGFFYGAFGMLIFSLFIIFCLMLILAPFIGLVRKEITTRATPNEGIYQSARSALVGIMIYGLEIGLIFGLLGGVGVGVNGMLRGGLFGILVGGVAGGLWYGGAVSLQHILLRVFIWHNGSAPLNYVKFLDYCAERIFLRKVGGGYIFVHRLLMEHFAAMYPVSED